MYDKLTYVGNLDNLKDIRVRIEFVKGNICDPEAVRKFDVKRILQISDPDGIFIRY